MRRILVCLVALALLFAVVAAAAAVKTYQVTGPVLEVRSDAIVVQKGKDRWELARDANTIRVQQEVIDLRMLLQPAQQAEELRVQRRLPAG